MRGGAAGWARSRWASAGPKRTGAPSSLKNRGDGRERLERGPRREPASSLALLAAHHRAARGSPCPRCSWQLWGGACGRTGQETRRERSRLVGPPALPCGVRSPPPPGSLTWDLLCGLLPRLVGAAPSLGQKGWRTTAGDKRVTRSTAGHTPVSSTGSTSRQAIRDLMLHGSPTPTPGQWPCGSPDPESP